MAPITFVNPGGGYEVVVGRIIAAITEHLGAVNIRRQPVADTFNVHFFCEHRDHITGKVRQHPDMYIAHGWNQKLFGQFVESLNQFRYIGVPGPVVEEFLKSHGFAPERLLTVGHPGMDTFFQFPIAPIVAEKPRVIVAYSHSTFAPLWKTMPDLFKNRLADEFDVTDIVHPAYGARMARDYLPGAVACLTDVSGTMFEAWSMGVPVVFPTWSIAKGTETQQPGSPLCRVYEERIGYHVEDSTDFFATVKEAAANGITPEEVTFIDEYFPRELRGHSGEVAAKAILRVAGVQE